MAAPSVKKFGMRLLRTRNDIARKLVKVESIKETLTYYISDHGIDDRDTLLENLESTLADLTENTERLREIASDLSK